MLTLVNPFMTPVIAPERPYMPSEETVAWCSSIDRKIVLEVFRRTNGFFGFQYQAWVAWRDAGNEVQGHGWWTCEAADVLIVDQFDTAREIAEQHARSNGVELNSIWNFIV